MYDLHPDIQKYIDEHPKATLMDVSDLMDITDIYGSFAEYEKVVGKLSEEDKKSVRDFNKIVNNYIKISNLYKEMQDEIQAKSKKKKTV